MSFTIKLRSLVAFAAGLAVAAIGAFVLQAWRVDAAPGDADATFAPITPCRLVDTRPPPERVGPNAALGIDDTKTILARGSNGNCTIPAEAIALSLNVTAVDATAPTYLTIWPDGVKPLASSLNPFPGQPPIPNGVTTNLSDSGSFNIYNHVGGVNVIVDVNGFYTKSSLTDLATRLAATESKIVALQADNAGARLGALEAVNAATRLGALETAQPFAVTARDASESLADFTGETIVSVTVTAPVAGHVTVNSTTTGHETDIQQGVMCSITTVSAVDDNYKQVWIGGAGYHGQVAGTRVFAIAAGQTVVYRLVCAHAGNAGSSSIADSVLTAIFTPA